MGIRKKNVITMLCVIVMNIIIMVAYYKFNLSGSLINAFKNRYEELEQKTESIGKILNETENIENIIKELDKTNNVRIILYDTSNNKIYDNEFDFGNEFIINSEYVVRNRNNEIYILKTENKIEVEQFQRTELILKLLRMEIILIFIVLILLGIFTYVEYLTPIVSIQESMKNYKNGIKPKKSKRKDEFGYLQNTFVDITENLEKEKQKQNRIIASISHDVKTPLTSIMGYSERLKKGQVSKEKQEKYLDVIYVKSKEIKDMVEEFDEYLSYNLEDTLKKQKIAVKDLMEIIKADYIDELNTNKINLEIINNGSEYVNIDLSKIRRVFDNLISNSIKHLKNEDRKIKIEVSKHKEKNLFVFSDNGTGVKKDRLEKIFEMLYTEDDARKVAGLGLSICKQIIELHEGKIWAENNQEGGLSIKFEI